VVAVVLHIRHQELELEVMGVVVMLVQLLVVHQEQQILEAVVVGVLTAVRKLEVMEVLESLLSVTLVLKKVLVGL
jgi:hypothetical protein